MNKPYKIRYETAEDGTLYVPPGDWCNQVDWDQFPNGYEAYSFPLEEDHGIEYEDLKNYIDEAFKEYYKGNPERDGGLHARTYVTQPRDGVKSFIIVIRIYP